jgi:hypothetical protein
MSYQSDTPRTDAVAYRQDAPKEESTVEMMLVEQTILCRQLERAGHAEFCEDTKVSRMLRDAWLQGWHSASDRRGKRT